MAQVEEAHSRQELEDFLSAAGNRLAVVHFQAAWAPQCGHMNEVLGELARERPQAAFLRLEAEAAPEASERYRVSSVPTFLFFRDGQPVDRLDGAHAPELSRKVERLLAAGAPGGPGGSGGAPEPEPELQQRLKKLVHAAPCMLFMKGAPQEPRCGFSRQIVALLQENHIRFSSFDILSDEQVRQGLKTFSNWPTYPQLYANGELLGGLDIVRELAQSGELRTACGQAQAQAQTQTQTQAQTLEQRLQDLVRRSPVMLFMKGTKEGPRCGFSRQILELLNQTQVDFDTFDILSDEEVRQGLKTFSSWPTYPQLYVRGELVGGLDIVRELKDSGDLDSVLRGGA